MGQIFLSDPAAAIRVVTPNDGANLPSVTVGSKTRIRASALLIAVGGDIKLLDAQEVESTVTVPAGLLPGEVLKVFATDTTATGITALY